MNKNYHIPFYFDITLVMGKEGHPNEEQKLYLRKGASETFLHILIKLLTYCYF